MCSHYQGLKEREKYLKYFGVEPPLQDGKFDVWPGYLASFIRKHSNADVGDEAVPKAEAVNGLFGLVPHWARDLKITKSTYNCRSETASEKPSFRDAYKRNQRCIIPVDAFYEPDWRSGRAVATRITHAGGEPLGIAGLWSSWKSPQDGWVDSFTMLTVNADTHPLMQQFHKPTDEKRMVVILPPNRYQDWIECAGAMADFMLPFGADQLQATPEAPSKGKSATQLAQKNVPLF
jgi:putative SOS response-associated peptidase YedK